MADNLIDVPDDNLANVPDTNLVDVPEMPTGRERQRAFNAQIRMGAPEQAAQMSAGKKKYCCTDARYPASTRNKPIS